MGWKKKERALTPEEAIAAAKKELAPFWYNSEPLLAAVRTESGASVLPLNSSFVQKPWVYVFVDPTEFAGERALKIAREWNHRYAHHEVGFIVVFRAPRPFAKVAIDHLRKLQIQFPGMYDQDGLFSAAFGIQAWPAVVIQSGATEIARGSGANWMEGVEEKLQVFLRKSDPGLSTFLPYQLTNPVVGFSRVDLGSLKGKPVASLGDILVLTGDWKESEDCISTSDPNATATIRCKSSVLSIIAQAAREAQVTKVLLESTDGAMMQEWIAENATIDENGFGVVRLQTFGLYSVLKELPKNRRSFRLRFPDALGVPVQIYGLRFGGRD